MKFIPKYGVGGVYIPGNSSVASSTPEAASSGKASTPKTPFKDSIMDLLKENGLDNDYSYLLQEAAQILSPYDMNPGADLDSGTMIQILSMVNTIKNSKTSWDQAVATVKEKGSGDEVACDESGKIWVKDVEGKIYTVNPTEYWKGYEEQKWGALTNEGLLIERRNNPYMIRNDNSINSAKNSTNSTEIEAKLRKAVQDLPDTQLGTILDKAGNLDAVLQGAQLVFNGGPGKYNVTQTSDVPENIEAFYNYAWKYVLNTTDRNFLRAKTAAEGGDANSIENIFESIVYSSSLYTRTNVNVSPAANGGNGGGTGAGSETANMQYHLVSAYTNSVGAGLTNEFRISPAGSSVAFDIKGQNVGPVVTKEGGTNYGVASIADIYENAYAVGQITEGTGSVTFGDQLIKKDQLTGIVYDGTNMYGADLPATQLPSGDWVPDFDLLEKFDALDLQGYTKAEVDLYLQQICPGATYDEETNTIIPPFDRRHRFLIMGAMAGKGFVDFDEKSKYVTLDGDTGREHVNIYKDAVTYGKINHGKNAEERVDATHKAWFSRTKLYHGNVFIPIDITASARVADFEYGNKSDRTNLVGQAEYSRYEQRVADAFNSGAITRNWE